MCLSAGRPLRSSPRLRPRVSLSICLSVCLLIGLLPSLASRRAGTEVGREPHKNVGRPASTPLRKVSTEAKGPSCKSTTTVPVRQRTRGTKTPSGFHVPRFRGAFCEKRGDALPGKALIKSFVLTSLFFCPDVSALFKNGSASRPFVPAYA